ncbi:MAG: hypothetical protein PHY47_18835 [Lachnospiraceae bacterium]|nr:hypothetical protein [Lachnospiraceae bacterium]
MSGKNDRNTLPKWCHTVLPQEGSLVIIARIFDECRDSYDNSLSEHLLREVVSSRSKIV